MLAYLLTQALRQTWRDIDLTVQEGLDRLASLCVVEVIIGGRPSYNRVPTPRDDVRQLFEAAGVATPAALPLDPARVASQANPPTATKSEIRSTRCQERAKPRYTGNIRYKAPPLSRCQLRRRRKSNTGPAERYNKSLVTRKQSGSAPLAHRESRILFGSNQVLLGAPAT